MKSVGAYLVLIESLDRISLQVPVQVSFLDYAGFKTRALLHKSEVDWSSIQSTVNEAQQHWNAIEPRVMDKGLRDAVNTAMEGMKKASAGRNTDMADFAAQVDLALVDSKDISSGRRSKWCSDFLFLPHRARFRIKRVI